MRVDDCQRVPEINRQIKEQVAQVTDHGLALGRILLVILGHLGPVDHCPPLLNVRGPVRLRKLSHHPRSRGVQLNKGEEDVRAQD
jgi:hypothetical protein